MADKQLYSTDEYDLLELINSTTGVQNLALVGHEPTISSAAAGLCDPSCGFIPGVPTGTALILDFEGDWGELTWGQAQLVRTILTPVRS